MEHHRTHRRGAPRDEVVGGDRRVDRGRLPEPSLHANAPEAARAPRSCSASGRASRISATLRARSAGPSVGIEETLRSSAWIGASYDGPPCGDRPMVSPVAPRATGAASRDRPGPPVWIVRGAPDYDCARPMTHTFHPASVSLRPTTRAILRVGDRGPAAAWRRFRQRPRRARVAHRAELRALHAAVRALRLPDRAVGHRARAGALRTTASRA